MNVEMKDLKKKKKSWQEGGGLKGKKRRKRELCDPLLWIYLCPTPCLLHKGYVYPKTHTPFPAYSSIAFSLFTEGLIDRIDK